MFSETQAKRERKEGMGKLIYEPNLRHPNPQPLSVMERPGEQKVRFTVAMVTGNAELGPLQLPKGP